MVRVNETNKQGEQRKLTRSLNNERGTKTPKKWGTERGHTKKYTNKKS